MFASSTNVSSKLNFKVVFKFNYIHICVSDLVKELCSTVFKSSLQKSADKNFGRKKSNNAFFYFFPSKKISTDLFLFNSSNEKTKTLVFCWVMESDESHSLIEPPCQSISVFGRGQVCLLLAGFFPEEGGGPTAITRVQLAPPGAPYSWRGLAAFGLSSRKLIFKDRFRTWADTFQPP